MLNELVNRWKNGPSPQELAARELQHAKRALLESQTAEEYARSQVQYNVQRIVRLEAYLRNGGEIK